MKVLLVGEYREGKVLETTYELVSFANKLGADSAMVAVGTDADLPKYAGTLYLADAAKLSEYNPAAHKQAVLDAVSKENPDAVVFVHSSYGWDLAPRVAAALGAGQVSEVVAVDGDDFVVPACNSKLRRNVKVASGKKVITIQAGAFQPAADGSPNVVKLDTASGSGVEFAGYEAAEKRGVDLTKADIIVTAGRGVGKKDNIPVIQALAEAFGGELGASRPVVDNEWLDHSHQVGTTGQTVSPKLYVACGVSGAIQHLAGMKKSEFVVAINTDKDAPIGEVADVLVVADVLQFAPVLTQKLKK